MDVQLDGGGIEEYRLDRDRLGPLGLLGSRNGGLYQPHDDVAETVGLDQLRVVLEGAFAGNAGIADLTEAAEPLAQFAFGEGLGEASIAFAGEGSKDGAAKGDGGIFLEQELIARAESAKFTGLIGFGLALGKFLGEGDLEEAFFEAEFEEKVVDRFELFSEARIFEIADDSGNKGAKSFLVGEEGGGWKGKGEGHN